MHDPDARNHLLELLPRAHRLRLLAAGESIDLVIGDALGEPGERTRHVYFPTRGFISLLTPTDDAPALEVGMVGREGVVGLHLALGVDVVPLRAIVQGSGSAWRCSAGRFKRELSLSPPLRSVLGRYACVLLQQRAALAACVRYHDIGSRLARWLLMTHDRADAVKFAVTHDFLAYMLGVRRAGVTHAAIRLQRAGLIHYRRGELTILDRVGLEAAACPCYGADRMRYVRILEPHRSAQVGRSSRG